MIITISGSPGSGKSTIAKALLERLKAERIYAGGIMRDLARERGMTLEEFLEYMRIHPEVERDVDERVAKIARDLEKRGKVVLVEGRTQFHFIPESVKVYVFVSSKEAAKRIWKDLHSEEAKKARNEAEYFSVEELERGIIERDEKDALRYQKIYGVDHRDLAHYDFTLDTTYLTPVQAVENVLKFVHAKKKLLSR